MTKSKLVVNNENVELSPTVTKILAKTLSYIAKENQGGESSG